MKIRTLALAIGAFGLALSAEALSPELVEWGRGPAQFLMTKDEEARWKSITTDDAANPFIALFWMRRDPTPATERNEFREEYQARVQYADENFGVPKRTRGALTERGQTLIVFGPPKTILRSRGQNSATLAENEQREGTVTEQWVYEGSDVVNQIFDAPRAQIRFTDRFGTGDYRLERSALDMAAAQQRAVERTITQPELTEAMLFAAPAAPAPALPVELATESLRRAVSEFKPDAKAPRVFAAWGQYVMAGGESFVPVMLYVPKSANLGAAQDLTFFGVIQDASGRNIAAFEEAAKLSASRDDFYVDRSLRGLPAGKHRGIFGLAQNGKPIAMASADLDLVAVDPRATDASPLILSNNVYPLTEAQAPDAPFTFGGVKVIPKADRTFRKADELWYFVELLNPGVAELAAGGAAPKVQVRIDVEGPKKMIEPPRVVEATPMKGVPGHYGLGSAIPLATFPPGEYRFTVKVIDTVRKASFTRSESFRVAE